MPTSQFLQARKKGEVAQTYIASMFRKWGLTVRETPRGYHPGYDQEVEGPFYGNHIRFKNEVKWDRKAQETGNLYIDANQ